MNRLTIVLTATLLTACAPTSEEVRQTWQGRTIQEAFAELGPPTRTTQLPDGILVYSWEQQYGSALQARRPRCAKGLHVDETGTIVSASQLSESLACK